MIRYSSDHGHAEYIFKVVAPNGISFHVIDRYSSMRQFQSLLRKDLDDSVNLSDLPAFPKKTFMTKMDASFLDNRMSQLGMFLNALLSKNKVAKNKLVLTYFAQNAADQDSQDKIVELNDLIQKSSSGQKPTAAPASPKAAPPQAAV
mmetsp:Transcript_21226/g.32891  ORF Transcript_21226/g.32891 Transcript_21226/m.32891 type:complete len:147 (+) Transcript_21226:44-484(+)